VNLTKIEEDPLEILLEMRERNMIVVDTSVWVDLFIPKNRRRSDLAEKVF